MAPVIGVDRWTEQHGVVGTQLLAGHFPAEVSQLAERRQVGRAEGGVAHEPGGATRW